MFALMIVLLLLLPTAASARIYKWVDEAGTTVYSDAPPAKTVKVKNVEVVVEDEKIPSATAARIAQADAMRREQQLADRIYGLERQLQAQQTYQVAMPPPPDYGYAGAYAPDYYPFGYPYPYFAVPAGFVRPFRPFAAPRFASARFANFHHRGAGGRGRR